MRLGTRAGVAVVAVTLGAGILGPSPASAEHEGAVKITFSKHKSGQFGKEPIFYTLDEGDTRTLYLKVRNKGDVTLEVNMAEATDAGLAFKYFRGFKGGANITDAVGSVGGFYYLLKPGRVNEFRWRVKLIGEYGCAGTVVGWPGNPSNRDSVGILVNLDGC